jgi:hypothetical protein
MIAAQIMIHAVCGSRCVPQVALRWTLSSGRKRREEGLLLDGWGLWELRSVMATQRSTKEAYGKWCKSVHIVVRRSEVVT